jgi:hypothetical protein
MCAECARLLTAAQKATIDHIRLLSKLQIGKLVGNHEEATTLAALIPAALADRQQATLRYNQHRDGHSISNRARREIANNPNA